MTMMPVNETLTLSNSSTVNLSQSLLHQLWNAESIWMRQAILGGLYILALGQAALGPLLTTALTLLGRAATRPVSKFLSSLTLSSTTTNPSWLTEANEREDGVVSTSSGGPVPAVATFEEDRKSARASKQDIAFLHNRGYNRYRFVSKNFIHRNKLQEEQHAPVQEEENEKDQKDAAGERKRRRKQGKGAK